MRAKYCRKKNTYTMEDCRDCDCQYITKQGIGSIHSNNHESTIVNTDTSRTINRDN